MIYIKPSTGAELELDHELSYDSARCACSCSAGLQMFVFQRAPHRRYTGKFQPSLIFLVKL